MVCMDGFILTHAYERVDMPTQEQVDAFLPPYEPRQVLDPNEPVSIGAMVGPEAFMEVRYLAHAKQMQALELIPQLAAEFKAGLRPRLGRPDPHLPRRGRRNHRHRPGLGAGHDQGHGRRDARRRHKIGVLGITSFRPFPLLGGAPRR
jgi:pyruvate ferredoxin oxidoreductase alpha subunit